ncbi:MAG: hypothetical protein K2N80_04075 [Lachnospiraceae bacterium]|nr:hypothetical protein [Lachnospiraceae bacterium]
MYEQIGEFKPDSLIAGNEFPIMKEGIGLKAGQGILKRGSLIIKDADKTGYIAGQTQTTGNAESEQTETIAGSVFGILTDDIDTGTDASADNIPVVCYQTGEFNREAVFVSGEAAVENYEDDMKRMGIYLRGVQKCE